VFLDRDGVLNEIVLRNGSPGSPRLLSELRVVAGAALALGRLRDAGFTLICVTNQPEIRRGFLSRDNLEAIHAELRRQLPLDDLLVCPHDDEDRCDCRKPKPGMLLQAAAQNDVRLPASYMLGDRWRDVGAGARAGCRTVLLAGDHQDRAPDVAPDVRVHSLDEAVAWILGQSRITQADG
jgi:D-glycero-D-manno-heptose 1,7-bisphosphate phosphatase